MPHPVDLRQDCGGLFSAGVSTRSFYCEACKQPYRLVSEMRPGGTSGPETLQGALWCFDGQHSAAPLPASDKRRVVPHTVALEAGPGLQAQLDNLPADVETLTVSSGCYDDRLQFRLDKRLPKLRKLHLIDVCFGKIKLTPETTPALRELRLQNVPEKCDMEIVCPELRDVSLHYWMAHGKPQVLDNMLSAATKLESFDSYKLWSNTALCFASPELTSIDLHRADSLEFVSIWAPRLTSLRLQGCYSLDEIDFPDTHPLAALLPAGFACRQPLEVITLNSNLGAKAVRALRAHPRAVKTRPDDGPMAPTESVFASMFGRGGGDAWGNDDDEDEDEDEWEEEEELEELD